MNPLGMLLIGIKIMKEKKKEYYNDERMISVELNEMVFGRECLVGMAVSMSSTTCCRFLLTCSNQNNTKQLTLTIMHPFLLSLPFFLPTFPMPFSHPFSHLKFSITLSFCIIAHDFGQHHFKLITFSLSH